MSTACLCLLFAALLSGFVGVYRVWERESALVVGQEWDVCPAAHYCSITAPGDDCTAGASRDFPCSLFHGCEFGGSCPLQMTW